MHTWMFMYGAPCFSAISFVLYRDNSEPSASILCSTTPIDSNQSLIYRVGDKEIHIQRRQTRAVG